MAIDVLDQDPVSLDYTFQSEDFPAYKVCSSLYLNHLKSLGQDKPAARGLVAKLGLKALVLAILWVLVFYGVIGLYEAGYSLDLLSSSNYPIYGLIAGLGALSSVHLVVRHRAQMKRLFSVYAADPFQVRLGPSGFSVKTRLMDASFSWESCRVMVWKTHMFILHRNTMVILPERAFSHPMSAVVSKAEAWQTKTA